VLNFPCGDVYSEGEYVQPLLIHSLSNIELLIELMNNVATSRCRDLD
jgi:hypothetical protein